MPQHSDPHRPVWHFSPDRWMNDPKPFFHNGQYHVFFQHNPHDSVWGPMYWGHTVSRDLVHWERLPNALAPDPAGPDSYGCWTGCVVEHGGLFHILYTSTVQPFKQTQSLATSTDLTTWTKHPANPILRDPPPELGLTDAHCWRDPQAWREADGWYMVIGAQEPTEGGGGVVPLYRSQDLLHWEYLHPLHTGDNRTGHDYECPDFFPLQPAATTGGGAPKVTHVLLSSRNFTYWHSGTYRDHRFHRDLVGLADTGAFYAAKTLLDDKGRRILFGWITEKRPDDQLRDAGWAGVLSTPRVLSFRPDGSVASEPVPELQRLRRDHHRLGPFDLQPDRPLVLPGVSGRSLELVVRFEPTSAAEVRLLARATPDLTEHAAFTVTPDTVLGHQVSLPPGRPVELHLFVDHSVLECFCAGYAQTQRTYPLRPDADHVALACGGSPVRVASVDVWTLEP